MEAMTNKVWQHEKYFDEILALRLQGVCPFLINIVIIQFSKLS